MNAPEESVVLHAELPEPLGGAVVGQFETDGRFVLFKFARANLDVESIPPVGYLQDLGPSETVDAQSESRQTNKPMNKQINQQTNKQTNKQMPRRTAR